MKYQKFFRFLQNVGKDPSALFFEDELTRLKNRRFLLNYFKNEIPWQALESPVSLLLADIDFFKRLNDQYGYEAGDQALVHVSHILKEITAEHGLAVRYAGDEFIVLLTETAKEEALQTADTLLNKIHYDLFFSAEADTAVPLTLSIGVATVPDDANSGKELIQQADVALFDAKQTGRNRYVDIATVFPEAVSQKTAIHYLDNAGIVGRKPQFEVVANALKQLGRGREGFLIIDGAPGMGKTSFLDLVQRDLEKKNLNLIRISGVLQESYRPYYLISYIIMAIMNQRADKGQAVLDALDDMTINRLAHVIPQLIDAEEPEPEDDAAQREAIFRSFCDFFTDLIDNRPLVLLIDDFDYSDPASLELLHTVFKEQPAPILVCGSASEEIPTKPQAIPLELFRNAYSDELAIQDVALPCLSAEDIDKHVNMIFPGIRLPRRTSQEVASVTEGNPLFINEIIRKMVNDRKIYQEGSKWRITSIEKSYFPKSLEEIIQQKMTLLDEESREFIDRASAFGESTSLSMLAGFSKEHSAKIYDCLNEAVAQGIVRSEVSDSDENIRFSSKRIRDTIYEDISPEVKEALNEQIGSYKEDLYNRQLLPSKTMALHHYNHSADMEKARTCQESLDEYYRRIFNLDEARNYTSEEDSGEAIAQTPLSKNAMDHVPDLLRALIIAVRNTRLYPPQSKSVIDSVHQMLSLLQRILSTDERFSIICEKHSLLVNQETLDVSAYPAVAEKVAGLFDRLELKHLTFIAGVSEEELTTLLDKISQAENKSITPGFWRSFQAARPMRHIIIGQIKYQKIPSPGTAGGDFQSPVKEQSRDNPHPAREIDALLDGADLKIVQQIISEMLGAASKLKLYPVDGPVAKEAINSLHAALKPFFDKYTDFTIARVQYTILVNGLKMDTSGFETLAGSFIKFLAEAGLDSVTLLKTVTPEELTRFIALACQAEQAEMEPKGPGLWGEEAGQTPHIRVNEGIYGIRDIFSGDLSIADGKTDEEKEAERKQEEKKSGAAGDELDLENLPAKLRDMFLTGDFDKARAILDRLCKDYKASDTPGRQAIIETFDAILNPADWKPSAAFIQFIIAPLVEIFETESEPAPLNQTAKLCHQAAENFILFGEYALAAWVFTNIRQHPDHLQIADPEISATVFDAAIQGLGGGDRKRQQAAFELLSSMGETALPYLLNVIKQDTDFRVRRLAAELIKHNGAKGVNAVKRALMGEHFPEDRARMLDVLDVVTPDIEAELSAALSDSKKAVRRAGARLAERLNSPAVIDRLMGLAQRENPETAITAINLLGRLNARKASDLLIQILDRSAHEGVMIAVCQAMGQIGDSNFILPLQNILRPKRRLLFKKAHPSQVRVAAAYAVYQIEDPQSPKILKALSGDSDPRVREVAQNLAAK